MMVCDGCGQEMRCQCGHALTPPAVGNLRDPWDALQALWGWDILKGCFGTTKIRPMDIDGMVERNGHFLFLEGSREWAKTEAQLLALRRLAEGPKTSTVARFSGQPPGTVERLRVMGKFDREAGPATTDELRRVVSEWYAYADSHK